MAAVACEDRSTQCVLGVLGLPESSIFQQEVVKLLTVETNRRTGMGIRKRPATKQVVDAKGNQGTAAGAVQEPVTSNLLTPITRPSLTVPGRLKLMEMSKTDPKQDVVPKSIYKRRASADCSRIQTRSSTQSALDFMVPTSNSSWEDVSRLGDQNANAKDEEEEEENEDDEVEEEEDDDDDSEDQTSLDQNTNACKKKRKKTKARPKRSNNRKRASSVATTPRLVSLSALKPITAKCSRSGLGLVITYRPVFTDTPLKRKKTMKRQSRIAANARRTSSVIQSPVYKRDSGTNPRSPSPQKQSNSCKSNSFFGRIKAFAKRNIGSPECSPRASPERSPPSNQMQEEDPKNWRRDIPQSADPFVRHRSLSPNRGRKRTPKREAFLAPYAEAKLSARRSPTPATERVRKVSPKREVFRRPHAVAGLSARRSPTPVAKRGRKLSSEREPPLPCRYVVASHAAKRSPPPGCSRGRKRSSDRDRYMLARHGAKHSPTAGPSWAPEDLTYSGSRSPSPRKRSPSPRFSMASEERPFGKGHKMAEVSDTESPRRARGRPPAASPISPSPSPSPPPSRPVISEGWKVTKPDPSDRGRLAPKGKGRGKASSISPHKTNSSSAVARGRGRPPKQRDHATSVSGTRHHVVARSRSNTRSPFPSRSGESWGSRADYERGYRGERVDMGRHRRHAYRRRHEEEGIPIPPKPDKNCRVM
ncbi:serine/arginine repetitive matrix protein 1-like [Littorina saxatilis]|uniref:Uncharacterized protein n=1 Tax=Littorina saxatilis TaxID=31220 RepID=A0AAN9BE04_9CAEN